MISLIWLIDVRPSACKVTPFTHLLETMPKPQQRDNETQPAGDDTLAGRLFLPEIYPRFVDDCSALILSEVEQKGSVWRATFKMARKLKPNIVERTVRELLPEFVCAIEPCYADYRAQNALSFRDYLVAHEATVAEAIISVSDKRAERIHSRTLRSGYDRLRGRAYREIIGAMPEIANTLARYA